MKRPEKPIKRLCPLWRKWLYALLPLAAAAALYLLLPLFPPRIAEYGFTRGICRLISVPLNWLVSLFPFSLTEAAVVLGIPALIVLAVIWIVRIIRRPNQGQVAERGARFIAWCLSLGCLLFMLMDGVNFSRLSVTELMEMESGSYDVSFLQQVTADLAEKCSEARAWVSEDEDGCMALSASLSDTLLQADDCYSALRQQYPFLFSGTWRVKSVALSHWWSYTGFTGVYCPWLGEASVNTDAPPSEILHAATHEIAHTMGFAREDACNFLAYLACISSDQPDYVYSGYLAAYIYCANALYRYDRAGWRETRALCSDAVLCDLSQRNAYWNSFSGQVMTSSQQANDSFIKFNGVESGAVSYDEMVTLVLQYYDTFRLLAD